MTNPYFSDTRTTFIRAVPKIFLSVNSALVSAVSVVPVVPVVSAIPVHYL